MNALLPRIIRNKWPADAPWLSILDFGSGPKALHTLELRKDGYSCDAYEMGDNFDPGVHKNDISLKGSTYTIVMASNVINTLSSLSAIRETIEKIHSFVDEDGIALINFPISPRKLKDLTKHKLMELLTKKFRQVMAENHNGTIAFYCYKS